MVNEVRTLLLNLAGQGFARGPGEEYSDPAFKPVALPGYLFAARVAYFGPEPDRSTLLYRVRQGLAAVHATELAEFVTANDPRITYLPIAPGGFEPRPGVLPDDVGSAVARLAVIGEDNLVALFGAAPAEPYLTWKNLWGSTMPLPYRLGAFLLAVASRTRETLTGTSP